MIGAVLFDMYETLITLFDGPRYTAWQMAEDAGMQPEEFLRLWRASEEARTLGSCTVDDAVAQILRTGGCYSDALLRTVMAKRVRCKREVFAHMHPGIVPMLCTLRERGIRIGLVSNCHSDEAAAIRESELLPLFDAVCLSCEEGTAKPDEEIFLRCLRRLKIPAGDCLYVGDGGSRELEVSRALGMRSMQALWYLKENTTQPVGRLAEFEGLAAPSDVIRAVGRINAGGERQTPQGGKGMTEELLNTIYDLFRENFPFVRREETTARGILADPENRVLLRHGPDGGIAGCAVVNGNAILLLFTARAYRRQGIGSGLLAQCEELIRADGYDTVSLGLGKDYLMPGVPTSKRFAPAVHEQLVPLVTREASDFFEKRGYTHSWGECSCFDMAMSLAQNGPCAEAAPAAKGIRCRWAKPEERAAVVACADDACRYQDESFGKYYDDPALYGQGSSRVLIAERDGQLVGCLIVSLETEGRGVGSIGCTCVASAMMHRGIGTELVRAGTALLRSSGMRDACLNYTYSGLDKMYGAAGYRITTYYFMGTKKLTAEEP